MTGYAERVHELLREREATVASAESLTGGLIGGALTGVAGASSTFRGGIISYATDVKVDVLGVPRKVLAAHGAVHPDVASAMATGVREVLTATYGLAVTGVAGPERQDGQPVGTVYLAVAGPEAATTVVSALLAGDRAAIREQTVDRALTLLCRVVARETPHTRA